MERQKRPFVENAKYHFLTLYGLLLMSIFASACGPTTIAPRTVHAEDQSDPVVPTIKPLDLSTIPTPSPTETPTPSPTPKPPSTPDSSDIETLKKSTRTPPTNTPELNKNVFNDYIKVVMIHDPESSTNVFNLIRRLNINGYAIVPLSTYERFLMTGALPHGCQIATIISDDGYANSAQKLNEGLEMANRSGLKPNGNCQNDYAATVAVIPYFDNLLNQGQQIGRIPLDTPSFRSGKGDLQYMTLEEMTKAIQTNRVRIILHDINHSSWLGQAPNQLETRLTNGLNTITKIHELAGQPASRTTILIAPYGQLNNQTMSDINAIAKGIEAKSGVQILAVAATDPSNDPANKLTLSPIAAREAFLRGLISLIYRRRN